MGYEEIVRSPNILHEIMRKLSFIRYSLLPLAVIWLTI